MYRMGMEPEFDYTFKGAYCPVLLLPTIMGDVRRGNDTQGV